MALTFSMLARIRSMRGIEAGPLCILGAPMRQEYAATVGPAGKQDDKNVTAERTDDGRWRVVIDGEEKLVDAVLIRPGTWSLIVDGRSHIVDVDNRKRGTAVLVNATETDIALEDARRKKLAQLVVRKGDGGTGEVIKAPIAGKLVKVMVAVGDKVEAGQAVAVLEAMKMENEITAERGGTVKAIHAEPGGNIDTHDKLVTLE